jgi:hypothetical protein
MPMTPRQKYERYSEPRTKVLTSPFAGVPAGARLHISTPRDLEARIRTIPAGTSLDIPALRDELASAHEADATCPVTTAMYLRILVELALEDVAADVDVADVAPVWRVVPPDSPVAMRVEGATEFIADRRRAEGLAAG